MANRAERAKRGSSSYRGRGKGRRAASAPQHVRIIARSGSARAPNNHSSRSAQRERETQFAKHRSRYARRGERARQNAKKARSTKTLSSRNFHRPPAASRSIWARSAPPGRATRLNRRDRRRTINQTCKWRCVVIVRARDIRSVPAVFRSEGNALDFIRARIGKGSIVHADEADAWNAFRSHFRDARTAQMA